LLLINRLTPRSTLFPYTTLFRSQAVIRVDGQTGAIVVCAGLPDEEVQQRQPPLDQLHEASRGAEADVLIESREAGIGDQALELGDRKSTRLNSSHVAISYAVFCL